MKSYVRNIAVTMGLVFSMGVMAPLAASASEEGKRNTAIGLGAAAAYLLVTQRNKVPGAIVGAGALYAYSRYDQDIRARHRREQELRDRDCDREDRGQLGAWRDRPERRDRDRNRDCDYRDRDNFRRDRRDRDDCDDRFNDRGRRNRRDRNDRRDNDFRFRGERNRG